MKLIKISLKAYLMVISQLIAVLIIFFIHACTGTIADRQSTSTSTDTSITQETQQDSASATPSNILAKVTKMTDGSGKWQIEVTWKTTSDVAYYTLKRGEASKVYTQTYQNVTSPFVIQNLDPNKTQYFVIISNINTGNSILTAESNEYSIKVPLDDYTKKPGDFTANLTQSSTEIGKYTLTWTDPINDGATFYNIYKGITQGSYPDLVTYLADTSSKTYTGTLDADAPTTYFIVIAINSKGSTNSNEVKYEPATNNSNPNPIIPGSFSANATAGVEKVDLSWTASTDALNYVIQYGITYNSFPNSIGPLPSSTTQYSVTSLTAGTPYYFNIIAVSSDSNSKNADSVVSATPTAATSTLYRSIVLANNPKAYWPLQEQSGTVATDLSGNNYNGTYLGNVSLAQTTTVQSQSVKAAAFDGSTAYVDIPALSYNNLSSGTLSVWVKLNDITRATIIAKQHDNCCTMGVFSVGFYSGSDGWDAVGNPGTLYFHDQNYISPEVVQSNTTISQGTWYHLAVVFSSAGSTIYINGVASGTDNSRAFAVSDDSNPTTTTIGNWTFPNAYLNGMIAGLAIFPTVLSPTIIQSLYDAGGSW